MDTTIILLLLGAIGIGVLGFRFLLFFKGANENQALPYRQTRQFFTKTEFAFFSALREALPDDHYAIFPKVRIADFIDVTASGKRYWTYFNKINRKHVDYLVWDLKEHTIRMAIELDGTSHNSQSTKDRDDFINQMYEDAGLVLRRVSVGSNFEDEARKIKQMLETNGEYSEDSTQ